MIVILYGSFFVVTRNNSLAPAMPVVPGHGFKIISGGLPLDNSRGFNVFWQSFFLIKSALKPNHR
jgi:hypothetical protein